MTTNINLRQSLTRIYFCDIYLLKIFIHEEKFLISIITKLKYLIHLDFSNDTHISIIRSNSAINLNSNYYFSKFTTFFFLQIIVINI